MLQGEDHLQNLHNVEQFVLDEADRMIEKGHFEELDKIVGFLNSWVKVILFYQVTTHSTSAYLQTAMATPCESEELRFPGRQFVSLFCYLYFFLSIYIL